MVSSVSCRYCGVHALAKSSHPSLPHAASSPAVVRHLPPRLHYILRRLEQLWPRHHSLWASAAGASAAMDLCTSQRPPWRGQVRPRSCAASWWRGRRGWSRHSLYGSSGHGRSFSVVSRRTAVAPSQLLLADSYRRHTELRLIGAITRSIFKSSHGGTARAYHRQVKPRHLAPVLLTHTPDLPLTPI